MFSRSLHTKCLIVINSNALHQFLESPKMFRANFRCHDSLLSKMACGPEKFCELLRNEPAGHCFCEGSIKFDVNSA